MKPKLHPATQSRLNKYAKEYLSLYRSAKIGGSTNNYSRWSAGFALPIGETDTKALNIFKARVYRVSELLKFDLS